MNGFARATMILLLAAGCQPQETAPVVTPAPDVPRGSLDQWEHWYSGSDGFTRTYTDQTDWQQARVQGTGGTTLVTECNGQDPDGYFLSIEYGPGRLSDFPGFESAFQIRVFRSGEVLHTELGNIRPWEGAAGSPAEYDHIVSPALAEALKRGSEVVFDFQSGEPHRYTLAGSANVMDDLACEGVL